MEQALIERRPGVLAGHAVVRGTRVPVWIIVRYHDILGGDIDRLANAYPTAGRQGVLAALAYYDTHRDEIDAEAAANDALLNELERLEAEGTIL